MLYLVASSALPLADRFVKEIMATDPAFKKVVVDEFKDEVTLHQQLTRADSLFGEKLVFIFVNFPKNKLSLLDRVWDNHPQLRLILLYTGDKTENLGKVLSWTTKRKGIIKQVRTKTPLAIFDFLDAVSQQNKVLAIKALRQMEQEGGSAFLALAYLHTRLEKLLLAKTGGGASPKIARYAQKLSLSQLLSWQEQALLLEKQLKTGLGNPWDKSETWLTQLS